MSQSEQALEIIKQYGCIMNKVLTHMLGIKPGQAFRVLQDLACEGKITVYPFGMVYTYCVEPPGGIAAVCNGTIVYFDVCKIAREMAQKIERGTRTIRPSRLEQLRPFVLCPVLMNVAWNALRVMLGDSAMVMIMHHKKALVVHNPRAALERLKQVVESGVLLLEPIVLPCTQKRKKQKKEPVIPINVYMPEALVGKLDALVASGVYKNRSAAVREAVRKLLEERGEHV